MFLLTSCITPLQRQAQALDAAYRSGDISAADYHTQMGQVRMLQAQHQANFAASLLNYSAQRQRAHQPYRMQVAPIPQLQQPRSGWIMAPKGQMYYYYGN